LDCVLGCTYINGVADLAQLSSEIIANVVEEAIIGTIRQLLWPLKACRGRYGAILVIVLEYVVIYVHTFVSIFTHVSISISIWKDHIPYISQLKRLN
jgi:hypothetical protein